MRTARNSLSALALLAPAPLAAQAVAECDPAPPVTALVEPWEETSRALADGAVRVAVIEDGAGGVDLLVLTLPPLPESEPDPDLPPPPQPPRRCRLVSEGGIGFAALDLEGIETAENPDLALFDLRLPALRFVPESSELEEVTLRLTFGVADDSLSAEVEEPPEGAAP
ncbi:hypothetical protein [Rubellimicrobium sp. CFH 75288]|uniref:hypothetical protein n=1 Tax=Rubellimicrobium sp. CFH 75288 TaxID=2697034 RepID=UPI0014134AE7|nr:hypothetical protein [Rubellimicrobium sp. CFH 75288]NAZ38086.1 hypothetical protein [Rubellimicrobium sp. CFH 75288]